MPESIGVYQSTGAGQIIIEGSAEIPSGPFAEQEDLIQLEATVKALQTQVGNLHAANTNLQIVNADQQTEINNFRTANDSQQTEITELKTANVSQNEEIVTLQTKLASLEEVVNGLVSAAETAA